MPNHAVSFAYLVSYSLPYYAYLILTIPVIPTHAFSFTYLVSYSMLCIQSPTSDLCCLLLQPIVFYAYPVSFAYLVFYAYT